MYGQKILTETLRKNADSNRFGNTVTGVGGIAVDGLDELVKQFMALGDDFVYKLGPASNQCAELIAARARSKVHNIDNELANGIQVKEAGTGSRSYEGGMIFRTGHRSITFAQVKLGRGAMHGVPVELGHRWSGYLGDAKGSFNKRVPEHPFLRPAADESKNECANIIASAMNKIIKEYSP